ncbi:hypothetical protein QN277_022326 [Acacia crassicarpa]|uniref:Uncharacterized protein n=1 Tax=Acacia crassicarpa TaxID=499986 RepID=A0AAE1JHJ0_9FABA|nr:hypothetical protein QN277_022326 [Acacia crassicarpa]
MPKMNVSGGERRIHQERREDSDLLPIPFVSPLICIVVLPCHRRPSGSLFHSRLGHHQTSRPSPDLLPISLSLGSDFDDPIDPSDKIFFDMGFTVFDLKFG